MSILWLFLSDVLHVVQSIHAYAHNIDFLFNYGAICIFFSLSHSLRFQFAVNSDCPNRITEHFVQVVWLAETLSRMSASAEFNDREILCAKLPFHQIHRWYGGHLVCVRISDANRKKETAIENVWCARKVITR